MWILPSHARPDKCKRVISDMRLRGSTACGVIVIDSDDPHRWVYRGMERSLPDGWSLLEFDNKRIGSAAALQHAFKTFPNYGWYGVISDDSLVRTDGFEQELVRVAGKWGIASPNDLWQAREDVSRSRVGSVVVFGGEFLRAIGYLTPPGFDHLYVDDVWEHLGRALGNWRTVMNVVVEHDHPLRTGEAMDATHFRVNHQDRYEHDLAAFQSWMSGDRRSALRRFRCALYAAQGLSFERALSRKVMLATPVGDKPEVAYTTSVIETLSLLQWYGISCQYRVTAGVADVSLARNRLADDFLQSDCTDLVMIDADMSWVPEDIVRLLASEHPLIAAVGRKKNAVPSESLEAWCFSGIPGTERNIRTDGAGAIEIDRVGTGLMRIHRSVFEDLIAKFPQDLRRRANVPKQGEAQRFYHKFFCQSDIQGADGLWDEVSEDFTFCLRYRSIGGEVWIDPSIPVGHIGIHNFRGRVGDLFETVQ